MRGLCLPSGLHSEDIRQLDGLILDRRLLRRGDHLYRAGEPFQSFYALRSGFFKTYVKGADGRSQVTGISMPGDVVALDGLETESHRVNVKALDHGEACVIPYAHFESRSIRAPVLQRQLQKLMSREIVRAHELVTLTRMRVDARVARFLLALSDKFAARGYSATAFRLRMTRDEIGSYLGMKLETLSRVLSRFQDRGLIEVRTRSFVIVESEKLAALVPGR